MGKAYSFPRFTAAEMVSVGPFRIPRHALGQITPKHEVNEVFDPNAVRIYEGARYEGCFPERAEDDPGANDCAHSDGPFVLKSDYDALLALYRNATSHIDWIRT